VAVSLAIKRGSLVVGGLWTLLIHERVNVVTIGYRYSPDDRPFASKSFAAGGLFDWKNANFFPLAAAES
jgi:hypothetical protein